RFSRDWSSDVCSSDLGPRFSQVSPSSSDRKSKVELPRAAASHTPLPKDNMAVSLMLVPISERIRHDRPLSSLIKKYAAHGPGRRSEERRVGKEGRARR